MFKVKINSEALKCRANGLNPASSDTDWAQQYSKKDIFIIGDMKFTILH